MPGEDLRNRTRPVPALPRLGYGPSAGVTRPIIDLATDIARLADGVSPDCLPGRVANRLAETLQLDRLLEADHRQGDPSGYRRHVLFADPLRRFTILALVWSPGQATPVHGHTSWGAVGVYAGRPTVTLYERENRSDNVFEIQRSRSAEIQRGDVSFVRPGIDDVHRISNETTERAITIHVYGQDLLRDPGSINIILSH